MRTPKKIADRVAYLETAIRGLTSGLLDLAEVSGYIEGKLDGHLGIAGKPTDIKRRREAKKKKI